MEDRSKSRQGFTKDFTTYIKGLNVLDGRNVLDVLDVAAHRIADNHGDGDRGVSD